MKVSAAGTILAAGLLLAVHAAGSDILAFHRDPARTGWDAGETRLTPQSVSETNFGQIWESPPLADLKGVPPRVYASPLYLEAAHTLFVATSNADVYAIHAFATDNVPAGAIRWRTKLDTPSEELDGVNLGVLGTPVIDAAKGVLYVTTCVGRGRWRVYALALSTGGVQPGWPVTIDRDAMSRPEVLRNAPVATDSPIMTARQKLKPMLGFQRAALSLSPDGSLLYIGFGESPTGWLMTVDTRRPRLAACWAAVAGIRRFGGGIWGPGAVAIDRGGEIYAVTGANFGALTIQPDDWSQSVVEFSAAPGGALALRGTYTPFNYRSTATADIDLGSGGVCLIPDLDPATTSTPSLLAVGGKQGNVYLLDRRRLPGRLDHRPEAVTASDGDASLLAPEPQPQFGRRGPLNVFGPYTETAAAIDRARSRSTPAYFRAAGGTGYLFVTGSTKQAADSDINVPPGLARLKIVAHPGRPAYLEVDQLETRLTFENPGSPVVTSDGDRDAIVWVLDENAHRSALLGGPNPPRPVLYALDALTFRLLWRSDFGELHPSGKYNEPAISAGTVFVGTDRIQAFGLGRRPERPRAAAAAAPVRAAPEPASDPIAAGRELYRLGGACVTCHQADGKGAAGAFPPLAGSEWVNGPDDRLIRVVLHGLTGPVRVAGHDYNAGAMPGFGRTAGSAFGWSDDRLAAVLTYIRTAWGNRAPPISPQAVAELRRRTGDHAPWTAAQLAEAK